MILCIGFLKLSRIKVLCFEIMFLEHRHQCNSVEKLADCQYGSLVFIFDSYSSFQRAHSALTYVRLFILIIPSEVDFKVLCVYFVETKSSLVLLQKSVPSY